MVPVDQAITYGPAELGPQASQAISVQILKRQDGKITVGIGHPHRF
jgi:hypothetical protein